MATQQAKSDSDPRLTAQVKSLEMQANAEQAGRLVGGQTQWMRPDSYQTSMLDITAMSPPFDRSFSNNALVAACSDATNPGVTGDFIITTAQVDLLAIMERSFRSRMTMRRPRAACQAMARKAGHGADSGPLVTTMINYIRGVVKQAKTQPPG